MSHFPKPLGWSRVPVGVAPLVALAFLLCLSSAASAFDNAIGDGTTVGTIMEGGQDGGCGTLSMNADGTYENAYAWYAVCCQPPYFGAFAECYTAGPNTEVCSVVMDITKVDGYPARSYDIYIWADAAGAPGSVLCVKTGIPQGVVAVWPNFTRKVNPFDSPCCVEEGPFWAGFWQDHINDHAGFWIGSDENGPGGCPFSNSSGCGASEPGWHNVNDLAEFSWQGPSLALGIGVEMTSCVPVPVETTTWGRIKGLYR